MASTNNPLDTLDVPDDFICPLTLEIMRHPLMTREGKSFERQAILTWIQDNDNSCPLTRQPLTPRGLVRNRSLELRIENWCSSNNVKLSSPDDQDITYGSSADVVSCKIEDMHRAILAAQKKNSKKAASSSRSRTSSSRRSAPSRRSRIVAAFRGATPRS